MEYRNVELSELIEDIAAGPFGSKLKASTFTSEGFPIIDGANLKEVKLTDNITKFVTEDKARSLSRSIAKRGDVVVTISGNVGQISYIPEKSLYKEYLCSQRQFRVTFDETKVYVPYLVYYFHTREGRSKILSFANQTGVPALSQPLKNFKKICIKLPSLEIQRKSVKAAELLTEKIELNNQLNDYLTELLSELFNEIIYRVVDHSDFLEFSAFLTERKEKCLSKTYMEYSVTDSGIQLRKQKFHKNLSASSSMNKIIRKNDLVFGISRKILNWGLFENEIGEVSSAYRVYSIKTLPPEYIARYIKHNQISFMDIIKPSSREGQGIMPDVLMSKFIPIVDSKKWEKYMHVVQPIKGKLSNLEDETIALSKIRDALLIKLLEGEISVTESTIA